jgi:hypothetical protein
MSNTQVDIMVDVKQALDRQRGDVLVTALGGLRGVSHARVSAWTPRMVLVDYDPTLTDTQRILGTVSRCGFDARLVGM